MVRDVRVTPERFRALKGRVKDVRPALKQIGATLLAASQRAFREQRYGDDKWPPRYEGRSPFINVAGALDDLKRDRPIKERRFDDRPALFDTGSLFRSLTFALDGRRAVSAGSSNPNAAKHAFGLESVQTVTQVARERLRSEYRRFKRAGGERFEAVRSLGFLHTIPELRTQVAERPFVGLFPDLEKELVSLVEDYIAGA